MTPVTYADLVAVVAAANRVPKARTRRVLACFFGELSAVVWEQEHFNVPGLGAFRVRARRSRRIANPETGEPIVLLADRAVAVRVAKSWRRRG